MAEPSDNPISKDEYIKTQLAILNTAKTIAGLDLPGFLAQINRAEAVSPMIDPTMYRKAQDNLQAIKKLAQALLPVKKAYQELFDAVIKTAARGDMQGPGDNAG